MRHPAASTALGIILGTIALFPLFMAAAGHDSTSIFVALANSAFLNWPFRLAGLLLPASASVAISGAGLAIHYAFYILLAWLLAYWVRVASRRTA